MRPLTVAAPNRGPNKPPWNSLPRIDWSHPLAQGLSYCGYSFGAQYVDLVRGGMSAKGPNSTGVATPIPTPNGNGIYFNPANNQSLMMPSGYAGGSGSTYQGPKSVFCVWFQNALHSSGSQTDLFGVTDTSFSLVDLGCTSTNTTFKFGSINGYINATSRIAANTFYVAGGTISAANAMIAYVNGVNVASGSFGAYGAGANYQQIFGSRDTNNGYDHNATIFAGLIWERVLLPAEALALYQDPYCFLIYPEDEIFSRVGAAAAANNKILAADGGSYSLTGTAATIRHAWKTPAGAGSYALTGTAAAIKHGYKVPAAAGSYALTGTAATIAHGWKLPGGAGSYALTGTAATLTKGKVLAAGAGSYALTGTAATLTKGKVLAAIAGTYSLSGAAASVLHAWKLAAGAGSYALTGTAASVLHGWKLPAGAGAYSLSGTDATIVKTGQKILSAAAGSYALAGTAASVLHGWKVAAGAGSYALTGTAASVLKGRAVAAGTGSYALTGTAASLLWKKLLAAGAGSYELSGSAAAITYSGDTPEVTLDGSGVGRSKAKAVDIDKLYRPYRFDQPKTEIAKAVNVEAEIAAAKTVAPIKAAPLKSFAELSVLLPRARPVLPSIENDDEEFAAVMLLLGD